MFFLSFVPLFLPKSVVYVVCIYFSFHTYCFLLLSFHLGFEVITMINMKITMFYDATPCLVKMCQRFEGICCLNLFP
jgi:hypothetical protein